MKKLFQIVLVLSLAYITAFYTKDDKTNKKLFDFSSIFNFDFNISDWFEDDYGYKYNPDATLESLLSDGELYFAKDDYYVAIEYFKQAAEKDSLNADVNFLLAKTYQQMFNTELARKHYKKLLDLDSAFHTRAYMGLGEIAVSIAQFDTAKLFYSKVIERETNNFEAFLERGKIFLILNDTANALKDKEYAAYLKPSDYNLHYEIANLLFNKKNYTKTIDFYTKCLNLPEADRYSCFKFRAFSLYYLQKYSDAINDYQAAIDIDNTDSYMYYNIAICYDNLNNAEFAIKYYDLFTTSTKTFDTYYDYSIERIKVLKQ